MSWMLSSGMARKPAARPLAPLPASDRPLYEQVRQRLIEGVSTGAWKPGEAIPTETALARAYGVAHDSGRLLFHFFHVVARDGAKAYPEVRTLTFRRDRADAQVARALGIAPHEKVIRVRNVLSLGGSPVIVDDITLPAVLFP